MKILKKITLTTALIVGSTYLYSHTSTPVADTQGIIEKVMNYPIIDSIARCKKDFGYNDAEMLLLEKELKRYLIMAIIKTEPAESVGMYSKDVDNLWHSFILFTREYAQFGKECAGHFIHHAPRTEHDTPETKSESIRKFQYFLTRYQELFNEEAHAIWFLDRCEKNQKPTPPLAD